MKLSVVVPMYNEAGNVKQLHNEILAATRKVTRDVEIIYVNDCSNDATLEELQSCKHVTIINLGRRSGQSAALKAGFDFASGDIVVSLDGDGQNDPAEIPRLVAELNKGYDCVSGWRKDRKDTFMKKFVSRIGVRLHHLVINDKVHDSGCTLKVYRAWCVKDLELFGEMHRYLPALLALRGARIGELVVKHRPRVNGKTKYKMTKVFKGFVDLGLVWFWQKYAQRPVHLLGFIGLLSIIFGIASGAYAIWLKWGPMHLDLSNTFLPNIAVFSVLIGVQLIVTGILADISIKNYYKDKKPYAIREVIKK